MDDASGLRRFWANPVVRGMLLFSAFRAVYGMGILVVTWLLATSGEAPWWTSLLFLAFSMAFSMAMAMRWRFKLRPPWQLPLQ